jgi:hypothetical protein
MKRRDFLISALASAASVELPGCAGSVGGAGEARSPATGAVVWNPAPLLFLAGSFSSIDLSMTLPAGIRRGGVFGLAAHSSPLPSHLKLSPSGILSADGPPVSVTSNVIFTYQEPD